MLGSTFLVGGGAYLLFGWLGLEVPLIYCLLFGSLISPTDPIAVMGILKSAGASKSLETKIVGESLFNDGVAVVVFLVLLRIAAGWRGGQRRGSPGTVAARGAGRPVFGLAAGWVAFKMLSRVDNYQVEVLITLALAGGGYALAEHLHLSAPIAVVVAGLLIGNAGRDQAMSDRTIEHLDTFWELIDEVLNAVLFVDHRPGSDGDLTGRPLPGRGAVGDPAGADRTHRQRRRCPSASCADSAASRPGW